VGDSTLWVVDAIFLAYAAHVAEGVEREAALAYDRAYDTTLTPAEKRQIPRDEADKVRVRYRGAVALGVVAMLLVPGVLL
jgi:hypothetical protein